MLLRRELSTPRLHPHRVIDWRLTPIRLTHTIAWVKQYLDVVIESTRPWR